MKQFDVVTMASGGLALVLEPTSTWSEFSARAQKWKARLNAQSLSKPIITLNECIDEVTLCGGEFWITYDDFQAGIHLEPKDARYNDIVTRLRHELLHGDETRRHQ